MRARELARLALGAAHGPIVRLHAPTLGEDLAAELPNESRALGLPIGPTVARYTERFGSPCFEDEDLIVFDVRARP